MVLTLCLHKIQLHKRATRPYLRDHIELPRLLTKPFIYLIFAVQDHTNNANTQRGI
jgi:hypothetical protein